MASAAIEKTSKWLVAVLGAVHTGGCGRQEAELKILRQSTALCWWVSSTELWTAWNLEEQLHYEIL